VSGDGVAAQPWPNILFLSCDLRWGCDRRHKVDDDQLPGPSRLIAREQLGCGWSPRLILEIDIR
jgi:hypothetical protein